MQYREYGNTKIKVSTLGFGCMRFPMEKDHVKEKQVIKMLHRAMDLGVNFFDSAVMYCGSESETVLGKAIKDRRHSLYISTKNHYKGDDPGQWYKFLNQSLERLGTDYIDFYHLHDLRLEQYTQHLLPSGIMKEAQKAKRKGLIGHLCFSSHDDPENIVKLIDTGEFEGILVQYNLLDRHNKEVIEYAGKKGLGVLVMGPVGGGGLIPLSEKIKDIDEESIPALCLRFVLSNPHVSVALSGMSKAKMVEENVKSVSCFKPLSKEEDKKILDAVEKVRQLEGVYCTGCGYCMPCPSGVDIPANFSAMNLARVWGLEEQAKEQYKALGKRKKDGELTPAWAAACVECEECEPKCPQSIPITKQLKEVRKVFSC